MSDRIEIPGVPLSFRSSEPWDWEVSKRSLSAKSKPHSDVFASPELGAVSPAEPIMNAVMLLAEVPEGDFTFESKVSVEFRDTFDAGVLILWFSAQEWAKLCFEYSPNGQPGVVSVVCRGVADDSNAFDIQATQVWLRVSRVGKMFAFHASSDGHTWKFVRAFALGNESTSPRIGFLVQSPVGESCDVVFDEVQISARTVGNVRDGS